jgi:hypothetical protein
MRLFFALVLALLFLVLPARAAAEESPAPAGGPCALDRHVGITDEEARAVEHVVCSEVVESLPGGGPYRIRVARLGSKVILDLVGGREGAQKRLVLASLDEVVTAAPRLAGSHGEQIPAADTADVTNVVATEAEPHKKKAVEVHAWLGVVGLAALAVKPESGAGVDFAMTFGSARWSFLTDLRLAGGPTTHIALAGGVRHHLSAADVAAFVGTGLGISHVEIGRKDGGGLSLYGEIGVDALRTHRVGGAFVVRLVMPTFSVGSLGATPLLSAGIMTRF